MLTTDKIITTKSYWNKIYSGNNDNAKVDASNTKRTSTFDRFQIVADVAEGPNILGIASGHAHIEKRIKAAHKNWNIIASDQSEAARKVANYHPYLIIDAYSIKFDKKEFDTIICTQALEYMEHPENFLGEAKRVAKKIIITAPKNEMKSWSQLYVFNEKILTDLLTPFGEIELLKTFNDDLILIKLKFND